jgi:Flp pilus assembly protein CpaB
MATSSLPFHAGRAVRSTRRLDLRYVAGAVLLAIAVYGGYSVYRTRPVVARPVVVVAHDIAPGDVLRREDFNEVSQPVDDNLYAQLLHPDALGGVVGQKAPEQLHAGLLVGAAQVAPRAELGSDEQALSIPVQPENAAIGTIRPGDWVQIWATGKTPGSHARSVVDRVRVLDVDYVAAPRAPIVGQDRAQQLSAILLAVNAGQAQALVEAQATEEIDVGRLPAAAQSQ